MLAVSISANSRYVDIRWTFVPNVSHHAHIIHSLADFHVQVEEKVVLLSQAARLPGGRRRFESVERFPDFIVAVKAG